MLPETGGAANGRAGASTDDAPASPRSLEELWRWDAPPESPGAGAPDQAAAEGEASGEGGALRVALEGGVGAGAGGAAAPAEAEAEAAAQEADGLSDGLRASVERGEWEPVARWLAAGGMPDVRDPKGRTLLMLSSTFGNLEVSRLALRAGADVELQQYQGVTALMFASMVGTADMVRLLIGAGASTETRDERGMTAHEYASLKGHIFISCMLLQHSVRQRHPCKHMSARSNDSAPSSTDSSTCASLPPEPSTGIALAAAPAAGPAAGPAAPVPPAQAPSAGGALQPGGGPREAGPEPLERRRLPPKLVQAAQGGDVEAVGVYLREGGDVDAADPDLSGSMLMCASSAGHEELVTALLAAGASVNVRDENGCTALAMACFSQQQVTAKMLIDANAMIDSQDVLGLTALMVSALSGATSMVRLLLIAGADTQLRDAASRTAYDYAQINGHLAARKLLRAQRLGRALRVPREMTPEEEAAAAASHSDSHKSAEPTTRGARGASDDEPRAGRKPATRTRRRNRRGGVADSAAGDGLPEGSLDGVGPRLADLSLCSAGTASLGDSTLGSDWTLDGPLPPRYASCVGGLPPSCTTPPHHPSAPRPSYPPVESFSAGLAAAASAAGLSPGPSANLSSLSRGSAGWGDHSSHLSNHLSNHLSSHLSNHLSNHLSSHLSNHLSTGSLGSPSCSQLSHCSSGGRPGYPHPQSGSAALLSSYGEARGGAPMGGYGGAGGAVRGPPPPGYGACGIGGPVAAGWVHGRHGGGGGGSDLSAGTPYGCHNGGGVGLAAGARHGRYSCDGTGVAAIGGIYGGGGGGGGGALSKAGLVEPGGDDGDDGDLSMASLASSVATSALEEPLVETTSPLLLCPITGKLMRDPVSTVDGQVYEREAIEAWLETHDTSPVTGQQLPMKLLVPSIPLRGMIAAHLEKQKLRQRNATVAAMASMRLQPLHREQPAALQPQHQEGDTGSPGSAGSWRQHPMSHLPRVAHQSWETVLGNRTP